MVERQSHALLVHGELYGISRLWELTLFTKGVSSILGLGASCGRRLLELPWRAVRVVFLSRTRFSALLLDTLLCWVSRSHAAQASLRESLMTHRYSCARSTAIDDSQQVCCSSFERCRNAQQSDH